MRTAERSCPSGWVGPNWRRPWCNWRRRFRDLGLEVRLVHAKFVRPYVKSAKNDARDAEAICEAALRPHMRFIPIKSPEQLDIQALHRVREQLVRWRTALINQTRGLLAEHGIVLPQGTWRFYLKGALIRVKRF